MVGGLNRDEEGVEKKENTIDIKLQLDENK
jgi:hypothetical protein